MFVPPDQRSTPPRWEPPHRPSSDAKRKENAAVALIVLISLMALVAPIGGGTFIALSIALIGH